LSFRTIQTQRNLNKDSQNHPSGLSTHQRKGVPHISLVFREMWDTAALNQPTPGRQTKPEVEPISVEQQQSRSCTPHKDP
jgi:hypothetical protein